MFSESNNNTNEIQVQNKTENGSTIEGEGIIEDEG